MARLARLGGRALAAVAALIWLAVVLIPLAYAVIQTFKPQQDELTTSPWSIPHFTFANYTGVIAPMFLRYVLNSAMTSVGAVLLSTLLGSLAAYALARIPGRINGLLYLLFVSGLAVPIYAAIIPIYRFSSNVGLYDTLMGLLLPFAATSLPITVFILTAFMRAIPAELDQAMSIDGAGYLRRYAQLAVPLARPAVATVAIYAYINNWDNLIDQ